VIKIKVCTKQAFGINFFVTHFFKKYRFNYR